MLETDPRRRLKVGLFTGVLVVLLGASVLVLGKKERLFTRHVHYAARFVHVGGLVPGAPVQLNGVVVGDVEKVVLSGDPAQREIVVGFRVDARVASRVRADSKVRIRSLGLLGDRYLEVSSGSPAEPLVPPMVPLVLPVPVSAEPEMPAVAPVAGSTEPDASAPVFAEAAPSVEPEP